MPSYAGYKSIRDFIEKSLQSKGLNKNILATELGWRRSYITGMCTEQFIPSVQRCDQISKRLNQDPHILRVIVGHESPPLSLTEKETREINDLCATLTTTERKAVIEFIHTLKQKRLAK